MVHSLFVALMAAITTVAVADARFEVAGWHGLPQYVDGRFNHCAMTIPNNNGGHLIVALNPDGDVGIGVKHDNWNLESGLEVPMAYRAASAGFARGTARATSATELMVWFEGPDYARHLRAVGQTGRIALDVDGEILEFALPRSTRPVNALLACVQTVLDAEDAQRAKIFIELFRL
jgi:hypothetical protein